MSDDGSDGAGDGQTADAATAKGDDDTAASTDAAIDSTARETDASDLGDATLSADADADADAGDETDASPDAASDAASDAADAAVDASADAADGSPHLHPPIGISGEVMAIVHEGNSLYLGGFFDRVSSHPANNWLTLDEHGEPLTGCTSPDGVVDGMATAGAQIGGAVYVGGTFLTVDGVAAHSIVKLDAATCAVDTTFNPPGTTAFDGNVYAMGVFDGALYVGGGFTTYRGATAQRIAKLDPTTGALDTTFSPPATSGFDGDVTTLAFSGTSVYAGGNFSAYRGATGSQVARLVKIDKDTGARDTQFVPGFAGEVDALAVDGTSLFAGGQFTGYRGASVHYVVKIDLATAQPDTTFSPPAGSNGTDGPVRALTTNGTGLYIAGTFGSYRGATTGPFAKVDLASGVLDTTFSTGVSFAQHSYGTVSEVQSLVSLGDSVYAAGSFSDYRGALGAAEGIAKIDAATGVMDSTFRPADGDAPGFRSQGYPATVSSLSVSGTNLLAVGSFTIYGGHHVSGLAKVDDATFAFDSTFTPSGANGFDTPVSTLAAAGTSIYVGGSFNAYRGILGSAHGIAKLDATTGAIDATFSPPTSNGFGGGVAALAISGGFIYAGGSFRSYRGASNSVNNIAKLDLATGNIDTTFTPSANGFDSFVTALAVSDTSLFVAGDFSAYRSVANSAGRIAKLALDSGNLDKTFTPSAANGFNSLPEALSVDGTSVYVAGLMTSYGPLQSRYVAKLDATSGILDTTFGPQVSTASNQALDGPAYALTVANGSIYVGGAFRGYRGVAGASTNIAKLDATTGALDPAFRAVGATANGFDAAVSSFAVVGPSLICGGTFNSYSTAVLAESLGVIDLTTGALR